MAMVVNHNIPALQTYNVVNSTSNALQKSINKLSTGLRINSAADDAAGLAISEKMRAQVRGLDQAVANSQDGISMIQTAEGALSETHSILQRMRELSVQAANDTLTQQDRGYIQEEVDQLREEITRIGNTTQFNKKKLLNGDAAALWSSSDSETKAIIKGGLRTIDKFGQKGTVEGNYNIKIKADAGQGEVKKSDIFTIKHPDSISNEYVNKSAGVTKVSVSNMPAATYTVSTGTAGQNIKLGGSTAVKLTGVFGVDTKYTENTVNLSISTSTSAQKITLTVNGKEHTANIAANADTAAIIRQLKSEFGAVVNVKDNSTGVTLTSRNYSFRTSGSTSSGATISAYVQTSSAAEVSRSFGPTATTAGMVSASASGAERNASILFEVTKVDTEAGTVTLKASVKTLDLDGTVGTRSVVDIQLNGNSTAAKNLGVDLGLSTSNSAAFALKLNGASSAKSFSVGDKFTYNVAANVSAANAAGAGAKSAATLRVEVEGITNSEWPAGWGTNSVTRDKLGYTIDTSAIEGKDLHFQHFYLNENTGEVMEGDITLATDEDTFGAKNADGTLKSEQQTLARFDANYVGQTANGGTRLRDLDKFWDASGNFLLTDPQTITITQGDGKQASVTLYANDTLDDVAAKFNNAIANDLGQAQYLETDKKTGQVEGVGNFVTFTTGKGSNIHASSETPNTSQSVAGTFLLRTIVPGSSGTLSFSGDENVINAFSLNTIQDAKESRYTASITDAHTGKTVASNVQVTGNKLIGVIDENVDVEFDAMAGVTVKWNDKQKQFSYTTTDYDTTLHLSDNTTVFQIGANEGEDMGINIGDMRSHALGLDEVNVTNRASAARSITVIDNAIDKVSMQRAKLGAYQNRLEHTINNLNTASENLTSAESRIRDTDMAKEMLNFSKLQIMLQAGNSMLSQANQLPQNVLSLIR